MMLQLFNRHKRNKAGGHREHGSITVYVALLLVPTVFFVGFFSDLARLRIAQSQAVTAADDYAEAVLSYYDNVLKDLYGLYGVTPTMLDRFTDGSTDTGYLKSQFHPRDGRASAINDENINKVMGALGSVATDAEGKLVSVNSSPYYPLQSIDVNLNVSPVSVTTLGKSGGGTANLANQEIFASQLGDFMQYRIVQQLMRPDNPAGGVIDSLELLTHIPENMGAVSAMGDLSEATEAFYAAVKSYFDALKVFTDLQVYPEGSGGGSYMNTLLQAHYECSAMWARTINHAKYPDLCDTRDKLQELESEYESILDEIENVQLAGEEPTEEQLKRRDDKSREVNDKQREFNRLLNEVLQPAIDAKNSFDTIWKGRYNDIGLSNYKGAVGILDKALSSVESTGNALLQKLPDIKARVGADGVDSDIKDELGKQIGDIEKLLNDLGLYRDVRDVIGGAENTQYIADLNAECGTRDTEMEIFIFAVTNGTEQTLELYDGAGIYDEALAGVFDSDYNIRNEHRDFPPEAAPNNWVDFRESYNKFYKTLEESFAQYGDQQQAYNERKSKNEQKQKEVEEALNADDDAADNVRDIPGFITQHAAADDATKPLLEKFQITKILKSLGDSTSFGDFIGDQAVQTLLKFYTIEYGCGMFTDRMTGRPDPETGETVEPVSLTEYDKCKSINYAYGGELEYVLTGRKGDGSAHDNMKDAASRIKMIRMGLNVLSVFRTPELREAINAAAQETGMFAPLVAVVMYTLVGGIETAADWNDLKDGKSVLLLKKGVAQFTAINDMLSFIGLGDITKEATEAGTKLSYEQYLFIMLLLFTSRDKIFGRTMDLVELNVNTVEQNLDESGTLSEEQYKFKLADSLTAVNADCDVSLDFLTISPRFAGQVVPTLQTDMESMQDNVYRYSVIRSY